MSSLRRARLVRYVLPTYLLFWILIGATGGLIALKVSPFVITVMKNVCAWAPTFVIALQFRRLYPETTPAQYLRQNFLARVNPLVFVVLLVLQAALALLAVGAYSVANGGSGGSLSFIGFSALPSVLLINGTSGPVGEELGWRGFAQNELQQGFSPFAASLIVGLIWAFWHTPLWLLSGFTGVELASYVAFFLLGILSLSVMITVFYNRYRNILVPMWIHFLFNLSMGVVSADPLTLFACMAVVYFVFAAVLVVVDRQALFGKDMQVDAAKVAVG